ncbi:MAG: GNAT family N-acetyltransferase [Mycobacterium sp.]|nr:GNAT family N-acetyltransferase [Mycobacterium sp.]
MPPVRRAGEHDHHELLALIEQFYGIDGHDFDPARIDRGLLPLLRDDTHGQVWILGNPPIGYAIVTWSWSLESGGRDCILDELYVASRGDGLGTHLMTEVINHARRAGAAAMFLETEAPNERARHFYEKLGFEHEDSTWFSRDL